MTVIADNYTLNPVSYKGLRTRTKAVPGLCHKLVGRIRMLLDIELYALHIPNTSQQ